MTRSQRRVYDSRHFRAGAKVAQNRRILCWDRTSNECSCNKRGGGKGELSDVAFVQFCRFLARKFGDDTCSAKRREICFKNKTQTASKVCQKNSLFENGYFRLMSWFCGYTFVSGSAVPPTKTEEQRSIPRTFFQGKKGLLRGNRKLHRNLFFSFFGHPGCAALAQFHASLDLDKEKNLPDKISIGGGGRGSGEESMVVAGNYYVYRASEPEIAFPA